MLSYWKAPNGPVERVYIQIGPNSRIYGQRVSGDRVAWRGQDMEPEIAEQTARQKMGGLPGWSELRRMATDGSDAIPVSSVPSGNGFLHGSRHGQPAARDARGQQKRLEQRSPERHPAGKARPADMDTPYGPRDSGRLDAYALGALPSQTHLLVDPREPREIANILSRIGNLEVETRSLDRGRYQVDGCLTIDRIATHDLHRGIVDDPRPLLARVSELSDVDHAVLFLVEGGLRSHRRAPLDKIDGALSYVSVVHRIPVVETIDVWETVYLIARAIGHACHPISDDLPQPGHRRGGRKDHRVSPRYVLEGIPGVSTVRAQIVLDHFGTLSAVAQATIDELGGLPGLGPSVAQAIYDAFHAR